MPMLSFQEKTIWCSLLVLIAAASYFFGRIFFGIATGAPLAPAPLARLAIGLLLVMVAAEVLLRIVIATFSGEEPKDERDDLVEARSARNAYYILVTGLMFLAGHAALNALFGRGNGVDIHMAAVFILFALVVAETSHFVSQLFYYRRGV